MEYEDQEWRCYTGGHIDTKELSDGRTYEIGVVSTDHGIVEVMSQGGVGVRFESDNLTLLDYIIGGKHHRRRIYMRYSKRHLVTLAKRFSKEVYEQFSREPLPKEKAR